MTAAHCQKCRRDQLSVLPAPVMDAGSFFDFFLSNTATWRRWPKDSPFTDAAPPLAE
jgi:hypothetical protein